MVIIDRLGLLGFIGFFALGVSAIVFQYPNTFDAFGVWIIVCLLLLSPKLIAIAIDYMFG